MTSGQPVTIWWWPPSADGGQVPDFPPVDITGRIAAVQVDGCDRICLDTPAGPCVVACAMKMIAAQPRCGATNWTLGLTCNREPHPPGTAHYQDDGNSLRVWPNPGSED